MACLLQLEYNFLHGFFRCKLPVEVVDVEVKITSMQGMHIFRRDRTTQQLKCTPWSIRLHLHPTIIKKMKTFLEVEGKMGPIPVPAPSNQFRPPLPETNPNVRKNDVTEKRKRATPKKKFRPSTPKPTTVCPPLPEAPPKPKNSMLLSSVLVREDTPWPGTGKMSGNLFEDRNWLLPKNYLATKNKSENVTSISSPKPSLKEEPKIGEQSIISPKTEKCRWGPDCPFCKNQDKEDWDGKYQNQLQQKTLPQPKVQRPQGRCPLNLQKPGQEAPIDKNPSQTKTCQQWEAEMERLNTKYNLDCFSDSELDSEYNKGEQYCYEHGYETLI